MAYDGDSNDLTISDYFFPEYSGYQTAYGHTDSYGDADYAPVYIGNSGYYDLSSTGNTFAYFLDATTGTALYGSSYNSNVYLDATHSIYAVVAGYTAGESYSVTATQHSSDGNATDLTTSDYIYPSYSGYQTGYGHTDAYGDYDFGNLVVSSTGYYDVATTGNTYGYIYDATSGSWLASSAGSYTSNVYVNAAHTNYLYVVGYTSGESYNVTVTQHSNDGNASDLTTSDYVYPSYSGYQTGYGHTDSYGDFDKGNLYVSSSGYYDITATGNISAYVYDATNGSYHSGSNTYLYSSHTNYIYVYGYTTGESYSVTVTPHSSASSSDDYSDSYTSAKDLGTLGSSFYFSGVVNYGGDQDWAKVSVSSTRTYQCYSGGSGTYDVGLYDATDGMISGFTSDSSRVTLYSGHQYYVLVYGSSTGSWYLSGSQA